MAARQTAGEDQTNPLVIEKQGHFFAGGKYFTHAGGQFMAGQMYVEYQIPQSLRHPFPIVLWHGGGQCGACYTGTPDGREGWAQFFLRQGYAVYVVDQPGRGRSAYHPAAYCPLVWRNTSAVQERFTASARTNPWPQAHLHTQWPGSGVSGDPGFDQFYAEQLPKFESLALMQSLNRDAGTALLDRIGPAIILTHSEAGAFGWLIADARPGHVKAIVAVEPMGPPVSQMIPLSDGPVWGGGQWGLAWEPLTYSPAVSDPAQLQFVEQAQPEGAGLLKFWLQQEPARELINLKNIPVVILTGEASYHVGYDHYTSRFLTQAGVKNTHLRLIDHGIRGNDHMMMIEKNNLEIAAVITGWLEANVGVNIASTGG